MICHLTRASIARHFCMLATLCLIVAANVFAEEIHFEGVIYDREDASKSLLILNGETVQVGQTHLQYKILDAGKDWTKIQHTESGEVKTIHLKSAKKKTGSPVAADAVEERVEESFIERIKKAPKRIFHRAIELKAIYDLAIINNASVHYYDQKEFFPRHIKQLTLEKLLKESYADGESFKYRFYFDPFAHPDLIGIHADPLETAADLHYFFVGSDAVIRAQKGSPATIKSPPHSYMGHQA